MHATGYTHVYVGISAIYICLCVCMCIYPWSDLPMDASFPAALAGL